jgi:DNA-binding beta-propeller fold protein YncE
MLQQRFTRYITVYVGELLPIRTDRRAPVYGVTLLHGCLYIIRMASTIVEVYSAETFEEREQIPVEGLIDSSDMTSCKHCNCIYIADAKNGVVHRIDIAANRLTQTYMVVSDVPYSLSVTNTEYHVLVTCKQSNKLKLFTTHGKLVREIFLEPTVVSPRHAVQLASGQLVVCHGEDSNTTHRVCLLTADGRRILMLFDVRQRPLNWLPHIAVDRFHGHIYVADYYNKRIVILNKDMAQIGDIADVTEEQESPLRLCLDVEDNRLYAAKCGHRVAIFSIHQRYRHGALI